MIWLVETRRWWWSGGGGAMGVGVVCCLLRHCARPPAHPLLLRSYERCWPAAADRPGSCCHQRRTASATGPSASCRITRPAGPRVAAPGRCRHSDTFPTAGLHTKLPHTGSRTSHSSPSSPRNKSCLPCREAHNISASSSAPAAPPPACSVGAWRSSSARRRLRRARARQRLYNGLDNFITNSRHADSGELRRKQGHAPGTGVIRPATVFASL